MNRVTYDEKGRLDEVVTDGGAHLECMGSNRWFLSMHRADGSEFCLHFTAKITMTEEREPPKRLAAEKEGEAVTLPYDYSRCGITPANEACPLAARCARRTDPGHPTYQTYTAYPGGEDCDGFIEAHPTKT